MTSAADRGSTESREKGRESPVPPSGADDLIDGIDWAELQKVFLDHLSRQFPEMDQSLQGACTPPLARIGHSLKGSGAAVLLPRFTELGADLERVANASDAAAAHRICREIRDEYLRLRPAEAARVSGLFRERAL